MGSCISGGMLYTTFGTLGKRDEVDRKLEHFNYDLITLNIKIHYHYSDSMCFSSIFVWKLRIIP